MKGVKLDIGHWAWGIGHWALKRDRVDKEELFPPVPNPQSPIPIPHSPFPDN